MRTARFICLLAVGSVAAWPAAPRASAATIDAAAMRNTAAPAICAVTVYNTWDIPTATVTGFLLGDGRFAITDLAAVAQPGTARVALRFQDGSTAGARQFGLADALLGLVVVRVEGDASKRAGLPLAAAAPPTDGTVPVVEVGLEWGDQLVAVIGRYWKGPAIKDAAAQPGIETTPGAENFVRPYGARIGGGNGLPVLDTSGTVVAVGFDVVFRNSILPVAVPAARLRAALLGAPPQLRPFAELPKPLWQAGRLRLVGNPATPADLGAAVSRLQMVLPCNKCRGRGYDADLIEDGYFPCPVCQGEKIMFTDPVLPAVAALVEKATRTAWAPGVDEKARVAARAAGLDAVNTLVSAGPNFQRAYATGAGRALDGAGTNLPAGVLFQAEVQKCVDGPDGQYLVLAPRNAKTLLAVRVDDLVAAGSKPPRPAPQVPAPNSWVFLAGVPVVPFKGGGIQGLFVLPTEWAAAAAAPSTQVAPGSSKAKPMGKAKAKGKPGP